MNVYQDDPYIHLLRKVISKGTTKEDRTGTGTKSIFGYQMRFDLSQGFPLLTSKRLHIPSIVHELLWFLKGDTNTQYLNDNGVKIWNDWQDKNGNLGPIYGAQWRSWPVFTGDEGVLRMEPKTIDQISIVLDQLKNDPDSRRMIVSAWNVGQLKDMALPPCHCLFQFYTVPMTLKERQDWLGEKTDLQIIGSDSPDMRHKILTHYGVPERKLSCQLYQRSADIFLGVPFNIASYSLLLSMIAKVSNMAVGEFIHTLGDAHIYLNHMNQVNEQLSRHYDRSPNLVLADKTNLFDFTANDIEFKDYNPLPSIPAPIAV